MIKVVQYTGAKDPDEFILKKGSESFRDLLNNAKAAVEYKILRIRKEYDITEVTEKVAFVNEAAQILSQVENTVEREAYVKRISLENRISRRRLSTLKLTSSYMPGEKKAVKKEVFTQNRLPAEVEQGAYPHPSNRVVQLHIKRNECCSISFSFIRKPMKWRKKKRMAACSPTTRTVRFLTQLWHTKAKRRRRMLPVFFHL